MCRRAAAIAVEQLPLPPSFTVHANVRNDTILFAAAVEGGEVRLSPPRSIKTGKPVPRLCFWDICEELADALRRFRRGAAAAHA